MSDEEAKFTHEDLVAQALIDWLPKAHEARVIAAFDALMARLAIAERRVWLAKAWKRMAKAYFAQYRLKVRDQGPGAIEIEEYHVNVNSKTGGEIELLLRPTWVVKELAQTFLGILDQHGALNCVEHQLNNGKGDQVVVEVRRVPGKTMAQLRNEADARAADAEAKLVKVERERDQMVERLETLHQIKEAAYVLAGACDAIAADRPKIASKRDKLGVMCTALSDVHRAFHRYAKTENNEPAKESPR
jgi:hypothetical protein